MISFIGLVSDIVWNVMNRPSVIDLIDVLLLAGVIYFLLVNVVNTRVSQTLKGIGILLIATWLSGVLGMRAIHALLFWMLNAGPVLLIILFQSEIRLALEMLGKGGIVPVHSDDVEPMIDEYVRALLHLSHRRVGALIVIEQGIHLDQIITTGTRVDGVVTQPLLENIFEPNTPLHDGAVVIRGNRVVSAACLLPVSKAAEVDRSLGTRHRAALGLSEICDAKVLIVSEESGVISLAEKGQLTRYLDEPQIRQILHGIYDKTGKNENMSQLARLLQGRVASDDARK